MKTNHLTPEQRFELVMECRSSGLTDYQWCKEHGIATSTFYRWIASFREKGYPNIPLPLRQQSPHKAVAQEVVKLSVIPEECTSPIHNPGDIFVEQNAPGSHSDVSKFCPVAEISGNGVTLRISNEIDPPLFDRLIRHMRGAL